MAEDGDTPRGTGCEPGPSDPEECRYVRQAPRPLHDLGAAVALMSLIPVTHDFSRDDLPRATGWFPWVGWLFGLAGYGVALALAAVPARAAHSRDILDASLIVGAWALLSGMLHWDGLSDSVDGIWSSRDPARRLEVMRDSRIGAFGVVALVLMALLQVGAVSALLAQSALWPLLIAPVLGRAAASASAWALPSARREGFGAAVSGRPGVYEIVVWLVAVAACAAPLALGVSAVRLGIAAGAGVAAGLLLPQWMSRKVGGMTGDFMGATVLVTEAVVLVAAAMVA